MTRRLAAGCVACLATLLVGRSAAAQQYVLGGSATLASGIAGGGPDSAALERARTRLRVAIDFRVDEFPKDILAVGMLAELEPHSSFGIDLRYVRRLSPKLDVNAGGLAFFYPESLIGPTCGLNYHFVLSPTVDVVVGPELDVFIIGTDLPGNSVVWQGLLQAGIHVDL